MTKLQAQTLATFDLQLIPVLPDATLGSIFQFHTSNLPAILYLSNYLNNFKLLLTRQAIRPCADDLQERTTWQPVKVGCTYRWTHPYNLCIRHKSGPLGWAVSAGIRPDNGQPPYIYCSFAGGDFEAKSTGIEASMTSAIWDLDGFPDATVCGETYAVGDRVLYRRNFGDTLWHPVFNAKVEGYLQTVKVGRGISGCSASGRSGWFASILLQ